MTTAALTYPSRSPAGPFAFVAFARETLNARAAAFAARSVDVDADGRTFRRVMAFMLFVEALRVAYVATSGVPVAWSEQFARPVFGVLVLPFAALAGRRGLAEASLFLRGVAAASIASALFGAACVHVFHTGRSFPLEDGAFAAVDQALGFDWLAYARFLDERPALWDLSLLAYKSLGWQFALAIPLLAFSRSSLRLYGYLVAQVVALTAVVAVALFLPAIGAYEQSGAAHAGLAHAFFTADNMTSTIAWLRSDLSGSHGVTNSFLISFPSYHAVSATLFAWAAWRVPYVRWAALALNVVMLAATPVHGSHYFADVAAGVAIATAAVVVAKALVARMATGGTPAA